MWRPEFWLRRDVLRIGRTSAEHWSSGRRGLVFRASAPIGSGDALALAQAIESVFSGVTPELPRRRIDVVVESAWLPLMALPVVPGMSSRRELDALLRHRLAELYDDGTQSASRWSLRVDHLPGDAIGLGYGLPVAVQDAVARGMASAGRFVASIQPAFAWARQLQSQRLAMRSIGWWAWLEQDRTLLMNGKRGRIVGIDPAGERVDQVLVGGDLVRRQAARMGLPIAGPIFAGGWRTPAHVAADVTWATIVQVASSGAASNTDRFAANRT